MRILAGKSLGSESVIFLELSENGVIEKIEGYDDIPAESMLCGTAFLTLCMSTHEIELTDGTVLRRGDKLPDQFLVDMSQEEFQRLSDTYISESIYFCGECGIGHDADSDDGNYVVTDDGELRCKSCLLPEELLTELNTPEDLFKAKDMTGVEIEDMEEVATLFCDSSGFGREGEPALTRQQAEIRVREILSSNTGQLYVGVTGIGQFQVYVTILRKIDNKSESLDKSISP